MLVSLRPYQESAVQQIRQSYIDGFRAPLLVLSTGSGKCLGKGTPVLLYDGRVKLVENIEVGDRLMGPDSAPRRVLSVCSGTEPLYRIQPTKGDPYVVNESHVLSLKMTGGSIRREGHAPGAIVNIPLRDYVRASKTFRHCAKGWRATVDFESHTEPLLLSPYFVGAWLGDGLSRGPAITTGDSEIVSFVEQYARSLSLDIRTEPNSNNSVIIHIVAADEKRGPNTNPVQNALRHYHLLLNKHIPQRYKTGSRKERRELLAGIIDTDGHNTGRGFELTLKSERLLDDIIFVARSLGFSAYKKRVMKTCCNNGKRGVYFRTFINGPVDIIPCLVARKRALPRLQKKNPLVTGISVRPIGDGEYYGFQIDGDGLFLLGDFTVTHNTVIFCDITERTSSRRRRVYVLVHRQELLRQTSEHLERLGVPHGRVAPGHCMTGDYVQVASVQTLVRRLDRLQPPDLLIIDECHHANASTWRQIINTWPTARLLGVTATPCRLDGTGLGTGAGGFFDTLIEGPSIRWLIDSKYLSQPVVYAPPSGLDLTGIHIRAGDYEQRELTVRMDKPKITGSAIDHYMRICPGYPAIAFCASVDHSEHVAEQFNAAGIASVSLTGDLPDTVRKHRIQSLASGGIKVLTSCDIISEGTDIPVVAAAILLRPTQSLGLYLQQVGRALRTYPGKTHATILDHAGNCLRHGLPDDERAWTLNAPKAPPRQKKDDQEETAARFRMCEKCYAVFAATKLVCPQCGFVHHAKGRTIKEIAGDLVEVNRDMAEKIRRQHAQEQGMAKSLQDLLAVARARGHKPGWAYHVYNGRKAREFQQEFSAVGT